MSKEIPKNYDARLTEDAIYESWEKSGFFNPDNLANSKWLLANGKKIHKLLARRQKTFSIAMPPPNATGTLHIGHSVMLAIQDLVIRYHRLQGKKTLWVPGTDHAAIATQTVVEKILAKEGITRHDLGREKFLDRVNDYVKNSQGIIKKQIRKMGSSCDWSRERYTLDKGLSEAVTEAFVQMYEDGLIYRGFRIVNWCPRCHSTLADDEVEYKPAKEKLYWLKYGPFILATSRLETKLGDTAVAVHPKDARYKKYVGKKLKIPGVLGEFEVTVVADEAVDMNFGSGVIKVTPAHDFVDYEISQRHKIPLKQVIDEDGKMMSNCGKYAGLTTKQCREAILSDLQKMGLIEKIEDGYEHNLAVCYRCGTVIEPLPSRQWFIDVNKPLDKFGGKSIKQKSVEAVKKGRIEIIPKRFEKTYFSWMENLRDWCISRQIWFGHRIPVWYCSDCNEKKPIVLRGKPECCPACSCRHLEQDPDTLDTWFSSGLWTFSTLGWPKNTKDLKNFHPTSLMETGYDILFFWVARMIIMSVYLLREVPFHKVYLHGLVRTKSGEKMSKSKPETVIDPLDMIEKYGADSLRLSLLIGTAPGNDVKMYEEKIAGYRNFVNKLWNISRYILMSVEEIKLAEKQPKAQTLSDKWILGKLNKITDVVTNELEKYNFSLAGEALRDFTWDDFADWYLEISKIEKNKDAILLYVLQNLLKLWHPFMPYVTENIWQNFGVGLLMVQKWPRASKMKNLSEGDFELIKSLVTAVRNLRSEYKIEPKNKIDAVIFAKTKLKLIKEQEDIVKSLGRLSKIDFYRKDAPKHSARAIAGDTEIYLPLENLIDLNKEKSRILKELSEAQKYSAALKKKLENSEFVKNAPEEIVDGEKEKLDQTESRIQKLNSQFKDLE
ncbi:valine--tRNA ligase [Candidatus Parcubacteria bacterium]|nr:MAG: valine--tRNA ligase [Candidatus Parcubacteria bacterium]